MRETAYEGSRMKFKIYNIVQEIWDNLHPWSKYRMLLIWMLEE